MNVRNMTDKELADRARLLISSADPFMAELIRRGYSVGASSPGTQTIFGAMVTIISMTKGVTLTIGKMENI